MRRKGRLCCEGDGRWIGGAHIVLHQYVVCSICCYPLLIRAFAASELGCPRSVTKVGSRWRCEVFMAVMYSGSWYVLVLKLCFVSLLFGPVAFYSFQSLYLSSYPSRTCPRFRLLLSVHVHPLCSQSDFTCPLAFPPFIAFTRRTLISRRFPSRPLLVPCILTNSEP